MDAFLEHLAERTGDRGRLEPQTAVILTVDIADQHIHRRIITLFGQRQHFLNSTVSNFSSGTGRNGNVPSKLVAGVKRLSNPHSVPPPKLVPLTRSNVPSSSILITETPEPMLTSRHGNCGVGLLSKMTPYCGGFGLGRSNCSGSFFCLSTWERCE